MAARFSRLIELDFVSFYFKVFLSWCYWFWLLLLLVLDA
jgi:hypothetical protein